MAATTFDKIMPPIIFVVALLSTFIVLVAAMNPTIEQNMQANNNAPQYNYLDAPAWENTVFANTSMTWYTPNPYTISSADRATNWPGYPILPTASKKITFTSPGKLDIAMWAVGTLWGDTTGDRHELVFYQKAAGTLGKSYTCLVDKNSFGAGPSANATDTMVAHIKLDSGYDVFVTSGLGMNSTGVGVYFSWITYNYNVTIGYFNDGTHVDIWSIIADLFTFSLPGVPFFIQVLITTPILVGIGLSAYIILRSALPW